jgi:LysR family transcriptional regulator, cyn operon transcriptional activator
MELRHIRYFIKAAELKHFTKAAESLNVSQPTLSLHIQQLEKEFGSPLFDRVGRRVRLTEAGEVLLKHAHLAIGSLDTARDEIGSLKGLLSGSLCVGATLSFMDKHLPLWFSLFTAKHPHVRVIVRMGTVNDMEQWLLAGHLDLAVTFLPSQSEVFESEELFKDELVVAISDNNPTALTKTLTEEDLANLSLAHISSGFTVRKLFDARMARQKIKPRVILEIDDVHALIKVITANGAATVLPRLTAKEYPNLRIFSLPGGPLTATAGIMWQHGINLSPAAQAFKNIAQSTVRKGIK